MRPPAFGRVSFTPQVEAAEGNALGEILILKDATLVQDATIRTVLEYSENPSFEDLPELDLARDVFDKTAPLDEYGVDIDISMRGSAIKSGRFVFTKKRPDSSFIFPVTRQLENGVDYYFRNYKVRDGCISPPPETFLLYPSEVVTKPIFLQVWGGQGLSSRGGV
jgi:hypothetical protein